MMKTKSVKNIIGMMVKKLAEQFDPDSIILFGSHARGSAKADSDIDLLVVLPIKGSKCAKQLEMRIALHEFKIPTDIIVATPDDVNRFRNIPGTIIRPALLEGKVIYAR
jgi:uncharacterized protein